MSQTTPAVAEQGANLTVEMRPRQVRAWLDALPADNPLETSRAVCTAIAALNRQKISVDTRLKLLELYQGAALALQPALASEFTRATLPLPEPAQGAVESARQLQVELAYGYKLIILEHRQRRIRFLMDRLLAQAIQRALASLGRILAVCYQSYAPAPAGIWLELHEIYRYAVDHNVQDHPVEEAGVSSPSLAYRQVLLLALTNPYSLMPGEAAGITAYLARHAGLAQLQPLMQPEDLAGMFLVRSGSDGPPKVLDRDIVAVDSRTDQLLNTTAVAQLALQQAARLDAGETTAAIGLPDAMDSDLLRRLHQAWAVVPGRRFRRIPNTAAVEICAGIEAVRHFVAGAEPTAAFAIGHWLVSNESAGGMALRSASAAPLPIRSCEIIGLRGEGEEGWRIAMVRWVRSARLNQVELGIQLIAPTADVSAIKLAESPPSVPMQPALLLPAIPLLRQPETIVALRGNFQVVRELLLERDGKKETVRAIRLLEHSAWFERFQFGPA